MCRIKWRQNIDLFQSLRQIVQTEIRYYCDEGSPENLSEGSPVPPVPESGEATHYTWTCVSDDRKAVASCRTLKKTAWCGGNVSFNETADQYLIEINTCLTGTPINITETEDLQ